MIIFPNCKINLGLNIRQKKANGYHDIETVFFPLKIRDALEIIPSKNNSTQLILSGIRVDENENNLCIKAYKILKKDFEDLPPVDIHLHKAIPLGAGLGGGSADGVFMLELLNKTFSLKIPESQMSRYALMLGSDCPFFAFNKPCFATGRGEKLEQIHLSLSAYKIFVVTPGVHINTAQAFTGIIPNHPSKSIKEIIRQPVGTWRSDLVNDFEMSIFRQYPQIGKIKNQLYSKGAIYASMSGSGSTVYGIFEKQHMPEPEFPGEYFFKIIDPI